MRRLLFASFGLLTCLACGTLKVYRITELHFPNKTGKLKNGLRVVIQPDETIPYVVAAVRYDVGAAFDPKDKKGLAHLIEHLAFRVGDELVDAELGKSEVAAVKAAAGDDESKEKKEKKEKFRTVRYLANDNAWTSLDETVYWKQVVPAHLGDVLEDFAEQMGDFSAEINEEIFKTERDVVRNERRSSYEEEPLDRVVLDLYDRLYPPDHPYQGHAVIGSQETIANIELSDVATFLRQHYHPSNATLVILGPVDPDATLALVAEHFGDKPAAEPSVLEAPDWQPSQRRETISVPDAKETMVTVAWPLPADYTDEIAAAKILRSKGWFGYRLVTNRGWCYWVSSGVWEGAQGSLFVVRALLKDHDNVDAVVDKIFEIANSMPSNVRRDLHIDKPRRSRVYAKIFGAESPRNRAYTMLEYFARLGHPMSWDKELTRLEDLTPAKVRSMGEFLEADRAFVMVHTPESKTAGGATPAYSKKAAEKADSALDHDERDRPPPVYDFSQPFDEFRKWVTDDVAHWEKAPEILLDNGIRVRVVQRGHLPILTVRAVFGGGQLAEPRDQHGVASLMLGNMHLPGAAHREQQYKMGVRHHYDVGDESLAYQQKFLSVYADRGLELFAEELQSPTFSRRSLIDARDSYVQALGDSERDVDLLAARGLWRARGLEQLSPISTKQSVTNIGLGAVEDFYERVIYPENTLLTIASDLPLEQIEPLVRKHFGGWSKTDRPPIETRALITGSKNPPAGEIITIDVPKAVQSKILLGFDAAGWSDWKAQRLAAAVAELLDVKVERIRKAMGVTYGVSTFAWAWEEHGLLGVSTKVEHGASDRTLRVLLDILEDFRKTPVTDDQVDFVKRTLLDNYTSSGHTVASVAENHAGLMRTRRPRGHKRMVVDWIADVSKREIQDAVDTLLGGQPTLVIAGKDPEIPSERSRLTGEVREYTASELLE